MGQLAEVPLSRIRANTVSLRPPDVETEEFQGLVDSMRQGAFFGAVLVRSKTDPETKEEYLEIIDGLQRFTAAGHAGLTTINVDIVEMDDARVLRTQVLANLHHIDTKPAAYTKQLKRIMESDASITKTQLAAELGKSSQWLDARLSLTKIKNEKINTLIDNGKIPLASAYAMAKLNEEDQVAFVEQAMTLSPEVFIPNVQERAKAVREATRQGKPVEDVGYVPTAHLQKIRDIKTELEDLSIAKELTKGIKNPIDAFKTALQWVLHLDSISIVEGEKKYKARIEKQENLKKQREINAANKKAEKAKVKADEAAKEAAKIS